MEHLKKAIALLEASPAQVKFWEVWSTHVLVDCFDQSLFDGRTIIVSSDVKRMDLRVLAPEQLVKDCARNLTNALGLGRGEKGKEEGPSARKYLNMMDQVMPDGGAEAASLWLKLRGIGTSSPGADAGFSRERQLPWAEADMLLPVVEDVDTFRNYAVGEGHQVASLGSSLLPWETEQEVGLEVQPHCDAPRKTLLECMFYFKTMGFARTPDAVRHHLSQVKQSRATMVGCFGPKGLVRLSIQLRDPCGLPAELADEGQAQINLFDIARELALAMKCDFQEEKLRQLCGALDAQPDMLEYAIDQAGASVSLGFTG